MKRTFNYFWIITFTILVIFTFVSCGPLISGKFSYDDPDFTITFQGKNFVGKWNGEDISGTFAIVGDKLTLQMPLKNTIVTIIDNNTLMDQEGDIWNKHIGNLPPRRVLSGTYRNTDRRIPVVLNLENDKYKLEFSAANEKAKFEGTFIIQGDNLVLNAPEGEESDDYFFINNN